MYRNLNINPLHKRADDCTVRAIAKVTGERWEEIYTDLCLEGLRFYDMPSANHVWGSYLKKRGFRRHIIPDTCPQCYTVKEFAEDNPHGSYILWNANGSYSNGMPMSDGRYSGRRRNYGEDGNGSNSGRRYMRNNYSNDSEDMNYMENRMRREIAYN